MKKLLVLTAALVVVCVSVAAAGTPGVNLSWNGCTTSGFNPGLNVNNNCDLTQNPTSTGKKEFQGSFRVSQSFPDFSGTSSVVDLAWNGSQPDFWKTENTTDCSFNALGAVNPTAAGLCPNTIFDPAFSAGGFAVEHPFPYTERLRIDWGNGAAAPVAIVGGTLYTGFSMSFNFDTGMDLLVTGLPKCTGCTAPVCLVVNSIEVNGFTIGEKYLIEGADARNFVTVNGGAVTTPTGQGCPAATPAKNSTWGSVKALYR
jgi:hypothetical protein